VPGTPDGVRFAPVAFDFGYFREAEAAERRVETSRELLALDEELRQARPRLVQSCALTGALRCRSFERLRTAAKISHSLAGYFANIHVYRFHQPACMLLFHGHASILSYVDSA